MAAKKNYAVSTQYGDPFHISATTPKLAAEEFVNDYLGGEEDVEVTVYEPVKKYVVNYKTVLTEVK